MPHDQHLHPLLKFGPYALAAAQNATYVNAPQRQSYTATGVPAMWQVAREIARHYRTRGGVIALYGALGAGKTTLMQGLAAALGVTQPVTSPTFALVLEYPLPDGRRFVHMDLYRLADASELDALGFEEYIEADAVIAIEWAERAGALLPATALRVEIGVADDDSETRIISLDNLPV